MLINVIIITFSTRNDLLEKAYKYQKNAMTNSTQEGKEWKKRD